MPDRKQFLQTLERDEELAELLDKTRGRVVSEEELHEQRISLAFGNAMSNEKITRESVRAASGRISLKT